MQDRDALVNEAGEPGGEAAVAGKVEAAEKAGIGSTQEAAEAGEGAAQGGFVSDLLQSSYYRQKPGTGEMRHGTEGWQALETSFVVSATSFPLPCPLPGVDRLKSG